MYKIVVVIGIIVHIVLLLAVFDIYFKSPIHHGMPSHKSQENTSSKRLVLFVADGLRAESLYTDMKKRAPFLHSVLKEGTHGISHCQVPTESRPGHASILGGVYEDPSAIGRGWTHNPVDYDTVLNQSRNAWCWGSPDIVDIFNKDGLPHIHVHAYSANIQDFSGKENASNLDIWVFQRIKEFFRYSKTRLDVYMEGNVFFLHLLGLDTAGHTLKPTSKNFLKNIEVVDAGVRDTYNLVETFFKDKRTTYVFTSDHGMTDWGSHGSGSLDETEVPIIAWGAAVVKNSICDVKQVDIAPLIASLVNINIPVNSEGIVPIDYINATAKQKSYIVNANAKQMSEKFLMHHKLTKSNTISLMYKAFPFLNESRLHVLFTESDQLISNSFYRAAISLNQNIIALCMKGISYYNGYYRNMLLVFVTVGFVGWMVFVISNIVGENIKIPSTSGTSMLNLTALQLSFGIELLIYIQSLPAMYYVYSILPIVTWWAVCRNKLGVIHTFREIIRTGWVCLIWIGIVLVAVLLMVLIFFNPKNLSIFLTLLSWFIGWYKSFNCRFFMLLLHCLGIFPWLHLSSTLGVVLFLLSLVCWLFLFIEVYFEPIFLSISFKKLKEQKFTNNVITCQFILLTVAVINRLIIESTIANNQGLLLVNQIISWIQIPSGLMLPFFSGVQLLRRLISIIIGLSSIYVLMSNQLESLFLIVFIYSLLCWTSIDVTSNKSSGTRISDNLQRTLIFMGFMMVGFFGTGNMANINFFNPMWTRCFVSVFSPFTMSALILLKLSVPFIMTICTFRVIVTSSGANIKQLFLVILLFSDCMLLQFLYLVTNEGSWLEIGLSLSRFIVADVMITVIMMIYSISYYIVTMDLRYLFLTCK